MDDLVQFLRARLNDDEQIARAACYGRNGRWTTTGTYPVSVADLPDDANVFDKAVAFDEGSPGEEQAEHIARHDPARVLTEVAAKRQIIDQYVENEDEPWPTFPVYYLALPYADHPDYRQEWRP